MGCATTTAVQIRRVLVQIGLAPSYSTAQHDSGSHPHAYMQHPEQEEKSVLLSITTGLFVPENSPCNKLYISCCSCTGKSRVACRARSYKQADKQAAQHLA